MRQAGRWWPGGQMTWVILCGWWLAPLAGCERVGGGEAGQVIQVEVSTDASDDGGGGDKGEEEALMAMVREVKRHAEGVGEIPFSLVIEAATGRRVLAIEEGDEAASAILDAVAGAAAAVVEEMNRPGSPVRGLRRINEASRFFEDAMGQHLDGLAGFACEVPQMEDGRGQRSGYPDLRLVHEASGRVCYIDPKLYEEGGAGSSLRTFYYQPREASNKILDDGHHLVVGISHDGVAGDWTFLGWQVVDLAGFQMQFKAEFQGSNRDLYRDEIIVREGE